MCNSFICSVRVICGSDLHYKPDTDVAKMFSVLDIGRTLRVEVSYVSVETCVSVLC